MNLKQAARYLGVHYQTAYKLVRSGRLSAVRVGAGYEISEAALRRYLSERQAAQRAAEAAATEAPPPPTPCGDPWAPALAALDAPVVSATTVMELTADALVHVLGDLVSVRTISDDKTHFEEAIVRHADPTARSLAASWLGAWRRPIAGDATFERIAAGETVLVPHLRQDHLRRSLDPELLQYFDQSSMHSLIAAPAFVGDEVVALIGATRDRPGRPYSSKDLEVITRAAAVVAAGIERARNVGEALSRRRELVSAVSDLVSTELAEPAVSAVLDERGFGELICDPTGHVVAVNETVTRWTGLEPERLVGQRLPELTHPDEREDESELLHRLVHGDLTFVDVRRKAVRRDGSCRRVDMHHGVVHNRFAEPRAVVVVAHELPEPTLQ